MTLTHDRKTELLAGCPPVRRRRRRRASTGSRRSRSRSTSRRTTSSPARARSGPASSSSSTARSGSSATARRRDARAGRLLRRAVGPRRAAAQRPGRRRRADDLPRARVLGLRGGPPRAADVALAILRGLAGAAARPDRSRPALTAAERAGMTAPAPPPAAPSPSCSPTSRARRGSSSSSGTDRYAELRERHRAILRAAFAAHGGVEQGTEGDSFFVVFDERPAAVAAAVDGQRALAAEPWPDGRDGPRPDGPPHRRGRSSPAASLRRARHQPGGADRGGGPRRPDPRLRADPRRSSTTTCRTASRCATSASTGSRTCARRSASCQLVADGLPAEFPPLRSLDARPNNLPTQLTTFVGRERELAEAGRAARPRPGC